MDEVLEITEQVGLTWKEVCAFPQLDDLPFKIETNKWGQIVMSPTRLKHGAFQFDIAKRLDALLPEGQVITEAAIRTTDGTKVADVAWFSATAWEQMQDEYDAPVAPAICVEVISPSNAKGEIEEKKRLYFEAGAAEVWICDAQGRMDFFESDGKRKASPRVPDFPSRINL